MWLDLVVPVHILAYRFELVAFLFVDAVEAFQFAVGWGWLTLLNPVLVTFEGVGAKNCRW